MHTEIDQLAQVLYITIGVSIIVVSALLVYILWLWLQIHRDVKRLLRRPEVSRNGEGRPLRERR